MTWDLVKRAKARHEVRLLTRKNVVGLALGHKIVDGLETQDPCLAVLVRRKLPLSQLAARDVIPERLDGVLTDVVETGDIEALGAVALEAGKRATSRWRPAPGGVSVGHYRVTAGTLGCVVHRGEKSYILSNNHVLADSNKGAQGDEILQPARVDGGVRPVDVIARLVEWVPIRWMPGRIGRFLWQRRWRNRVDAALAKPLASGEVEEEVHLLGKVTSTAEAKVGMSLLKSGRTTGLTKGRVTHLDATVTIKYGGEKAFFEDQILCSTMSEGGDSGSLVVDEGTRAVGLLFAGSTRVTVLNGIGEVMKALKVKLPAEETSRQR